MIIYTDGSCKGNGTMQSYGGFGVVVVNDNNTILTCYKSQRKNTTNNKEELLALLVGFKIAEQDKKNIYHIYSDSQYAIRCYSEWSDIWSKNGWIKSNKSPILNLEIIKMGYNIYKNTDNICLHYVKGHNNILYNELADSLATNNYKKYLSLCKENDIPVQEDLIWE